MTNQSLGIDLAEGDSNLTPARQQWQQGLAPETRAWLAEDERYFFRQALSTPCLSLLEGAAGSRLADSEGRELLDFHGNSAHQVGFGHPRVLAAITEQMHRLPFCTRRYTNRPAIELAKKLSRLAPGELGKSLFAPGGTLAVGMALKLARMVTGRFKTISMWDSFHGASLDCVSLSGESMFRAGIGPLLPGAQLVPPADPADCPWDADGNCASCGLKCAVYLDYVMQREGDVAAVVAEPLRNTALKPPPPGYWPAVREICDRHGALLIMDETAICLGRTGTMFACENFAVVPDILTLGKGLGGAIMPLAAMIAKPEFDRAAEKSIGHYTHEKNPVACAAALAVIEVIESENLLHRARELGERARAGLQQLTETHPLAAAARGLGLLLGLELAAPAGKEQTAALTDKLMYESLRRGLSFKTAQGKNVLWSPPLTLSDQELQEALEILDESLTEVEKEL